MQFFQRVFFATKKVSEKQATNYFTPTKNANKFMVPENDSGRIIWHVMVDFLNRLVGKEGPVESRGRGHCLGDNLQTTGATYP